MTGYELLWYPVVIWNLLFLGCMCPYILTKLNGSQLTLKQHVILGILSPLFLVVGLPIICADSLLSAIRKHWNAPAV